MDHGVGRPRKNIAGDDFDRVSGAAVLRNISFQRDSPGFHAAVDPVTRAMAPFQPVNTRREISQTIAVMLMRIRRTWAEIVLFLEFVER
jgi:hypothetical protein